MLSALRKLADVISMGLVGALMLTRARDAQVLVLTDYIGSGHLLSALKRERVGFHICCTPAFPYRTLFHKGGWTQPEGLLHVEDYGEENIQKIYKYCVEHRLTHVLIQCGSFMVPAYNRLNDLLGNGKANSVLARQCSLDKITLRHTLNNAGLSVLQNKEIAIGDDILPLRYPCVLKPAIGTASEGVYLLSSDADLHKYGDQARAQRRTTTFHNKFLIEEYVEGAQFDVEGVILNGEVAILCIVQENYEGYMTEFNYNWYLFNAPIPEDLRQIISLNTASVLSACGIRHGAFHCEMRVDKNQNIKVLDLANRMGGGFEAIISDATGNNFSSVYYQSMVKNSLKLSPNKNRRVLVKYFSDDLESKQWRRFMKTSNIPFVVRRNHYRAVKTKMIVETDDINQIADIANHFSLGVVGIDA